MMEKYAYGKYASETFNFFVKLKYVINKKYGQMILIDYEPFTDRNCAEYFARLY